jgi:hypothetical protein
MLQKEKKERRNVREEKMGTEGCRETLTVSGHDVRAQVVEPGLFLGGSSLQPELVLERLEGETGPDKGGLLWRRVEDGQ